MSEPTGYQGMSCDEFAEVAAELALGVLTGRERAAALAQPPEQAEEFLPSFIHR